MNARSCVNRPAISNKGIGRGCGIAPQPFCFTLVSYWARIIHMATSRCRICGIDFYVKPSHLQRGWGKYCSKKCQRKSQFTGEDIECYMCKKEIYRTPKDVQRSKSGKFFCDKTCQTRWRNSLVFIGERHANWAGGRASYRARMQKTAIPQKCCLCLIKDKRILAVHHLDHNRSNNVIENLIWLCHNCHYLVHHFPREREKLTVPIA